MKISYAITVCNEFVEIQKLLTFLIENKRDEDEIVVVWDSKNGDKMIETYLRKMNVEKTYFNWFPYEFDGHFANLKNYLTELCTGDYIYQIDADEMISEYVMKLLPQLLEHNEVDVIRVPRINTVDGLTPEHIQKWRWMVNEKGWVNFPDYQWRIYRNTPEIQWKNAVHEVIDGYKTMSHLPADEEWCLYHHKTIERQEKQNELYDKISHI
jgi:hypothetical protein